jgi:hypothetical protein
LMRCLMDLNGFDTNVFFLDLNEMILIGF